MARRRFMSCGVVFLGFILLCAGAAYWLLKPARNVQQRFFAALDSGDSGKLMKLFDPGLREQVDEPILGAWMAVVSGHLGPFKEIINEESETSTQVRDGVEMLVSRATIRFEKGTAKSELVSHDDKIVKFSVKSESIPPDWLKGPRGTKLYRERGRQFLTHLLGTDCQAAYAMMHSALQEALPLSKLQAMVDANASAGKLQSVAYASERLLPGERADDGPELEIFYDVRCQNAHGTAAVSFRFSGMKGHILAFDLGARAE